LGSFPFGFNCCCVAVSLRCMCCHALSMCLSLLWEFLGTKSFTCLLEEPLHCTCKCYIPGHIFFSAHLSLFQITWPSPPLLPKLITWPITWPVTWPYVSNITWLTPKYWFSIVCLIGTPYCSPFLLFYVLRSKALRCDVHELSCGASGHKGLAPLMTSVVPWRGVPRRTSWREESIGRESLKGLWDNPKGKEISEDKGTQLSWWKQQHLDRKPSQA